MDEEYSDSVDTSTDMDVSVVDMSEDISAEIREDIPADVPEDDYSDAGNSDDASEDVSEEHAVDDIEYDKSDDSIEEDSIESEIDELDEPDDEINEDSLEELENGIEDYEEFDDIIEDTDNYDEEQNSEAVDDMEEIPEDLYDYDMTDQEEAFSEGIAEDVNDDETMDELSDLGATYAEETNTTEQSEGVTSYSDQSDLKKASDSTEINSVSDYMNTHNYGLDDFDTYSQDPQWRRLMRQEYPDYELPELSQENARDQLSQYMNDHNYGVNDYAEYSQDPIWRELHSAAFPDNELPPLIDTIEQPTDSEEFSSIVNSLEGLKVEYRPIELHEGERNENEIVEHLSGGDLTEGSCSSLALAYVGNKGGYDVLDFRDGESRSFFSSRDNIQKVANLPGINSTVLSGTNDIECANRLLESMDLGKEYYLATGQHASIVRNTDSGMEYLELQHPIRSGWQKLDDGILMNRFGCRSSHSCEFSNYLMDVDSLSNSREFLNILGYINTAGSEQRKGGSGNVR